MKVLITGTTGLLGEAFFRLWSDRFEVRAVTRMEMDLSDSNSIRDYLYQQEFDLLINPAGMTGLEQCLDAPELAQAVNARAPQLMATICREKGARLVHFSTDYVFAGEQSALLVEEDEVGPVNHYGSTKLAGEKGVLACGDHLICRVSWLFGKGRKGFVGQVLQQARTNESLAYISDKYSIPTFADEVVHAVEKLIGLNSTGLFHVCSDSAPVSWWDYATAVVGMASRLGMLNGSPQIAKLSHNDIRAFRCPRPLHTAMSVQKLAGLGITMPGWLDSMMLMLQRKCKEQHGLYEKNRDSSPEV